MGDVRDRSWKRPDDIFTMAVDFKTWPIQPDDFVVSANVRGVIAVRAEDDQGNDVSAELVEGPPVPIVPPDAGMGALATAAAYVIKGGTLGPADESVTYFIEVDAPTNDGEFLTERFPFEVRRSYAD